MQVRVCSEVGDLELVFVLLDGVTKKISIDYLASIVRFEENTRLTKSVYLQL